MNNQNQAVLQLQNLCLNSPSGANLILDNISYNVYPKDFIILLGGNGSGKSSLLKVIDRRYKCTSGKISFNAENIHEFAASKFCDMVVTLTQNYTESLFGSLTVFENCLLMQQCVKNNFFAICTKSERQFFFEYLYKFNPNLSTKLDTLSSRLSGGEQQALVLALNMLKQPQLMLLDEHTSALDPKTSIHLMELTAKIISENNIACILATHDLDIALKYGNKILVLQSGKIYKQIDKKNNSFKCRDELLHACY